MTTTPEYELLSRAAKRIGCAAESLRDKVHSGVLPGFKMSEGPQAKYWVRIADVDALMRPVEVKRPVQRPVQRRRPVQRGRKTSHAEADPA